MSTANLDAADLAAVEFEGLINEDVMAQIWDVSNIPLPFTDRIASDSSGNAYCSWTQDRLADPDENNATVDGADAVGNDAQTGKRVGNHHQYPDKVVRVSDRANNSDTIGFQNTLSYQVMMRQRELRRDVETISLRNQGSQADDGDSTPGLLGSLPAWLESSTSRGTGGLDGGFSAGIVAAPTPGEARPIGETLVRDICESIWLLGANPSMGMSVPKVIRQLSNYMFTDTARVATLQRNEQGAREAATAVGAVNVMITDYDVVLEFIPNRLMKTYQSGDGIPVPVANFIIGDPEYAMHSFLQGYRVLPLARQGTADNRQMTVDVTLKVLNEEAWGVVADVDPAQAAVG